MLRGARLICASPAWQRAQPAPRRPGPGGVANRRWPCRAAGVSRSRKAGDPGGPAARVVVGRAVGHERPHELREGPRHPVARDVRAAEGALEERRVEAGCGESRFDRGERRAHLQRVGDRGQHLGLEALGPLVPEEPAAGVVAGVGEAHGVAAGGPPVEADAQPARVREPVRLAVARRAGDAAVGRQPGVVEEHAAEGGAGVGDGVVGRRVVGGGDAVGAVRGAEMRRQLDGVAVRGGRQPGLVEPVGRGRLGRGMGAAVGDRTGQAARSRAAGHRGAGRECRDRQEEGGTPHGEDSTAFGAGRHPRLEVLADVRMNTPWAMLLP